MLFPFFVFAFVATFPSLAISADSERPNIIFILADDLGWGDLGVFHSKQFDTRAQAQNAFSRQNGSRRNAVAGPLLPGSRFVRSSRASLLTGVHQGHASIRNNQFDKMLPSNHTLGTVMQAAGYRTALIGKYGLAR